MTGYIQKYGHTASEKGLTRIEAERIFQLNPEPPMMDAINDYILVAIREKNLDFFSFFLHHYERQLNAQIVAFLLNEGEKRIHSEIFLDVKLTCLEAMLKKLPDYNPDKGAAFATYIYPFLHDAMLNWRMREEAWSFSSLDAYKQIRSIAEMDVGTGDTAERFAKKRNCELPLAETYLKAARTVRNRQPFFTRDEDGKKTGEDVTRDDYWDYVAILWNGVQASAIRAAFEKLDYREQTLLEKRNAVCMTCGRVRPFKDRPTFEELAVLFEGSTASGAERAYRRAVEHLTLLLVESGALHAVHLKLLSTTRRKRKIAAAVYAYQADCDGEWGELRIDFESGTSEIVRLADWDTTVSHVFAKQAIRYLLNFEGDKLPKETMVVFNRS